MTLNLILSVFFLQTRGREEYNFLKTFLIIVFVMVDTEYRSPLSYLLYLFEFPVIRINFQPGSSQEFLIKNQVILPEYNFPPEL